MWFEQLYLVYYHRWEVDTMTVQCVRTYSVFTAKNNKIGASHPPSWVVTRPAPKIILAENLMAQLYITCLLYTSDAADE